MEEGLKIEAGLEKDVKLFITRFKSDARLDKAFGQQVGASTEKNTSSVRGDGSNRTRDSKYRSSGTSNSGKGNSKASPRNGDKEVLCLFPQHREKGILHKLKDCRACPEEDKSKYWRKFLDE